MNWTSSKVAAAVLLFGLSSQASAQEPEARETPAATPGAEAGPAADASALPALARTAHLELTTEPVGKLCIQVHYPWKMHSRPSVEMRLLPEKAPEGIDVRPLRFVATMMKGPVTNAVYEARDRAADGALKRSLSARDLDFEILAARNWLDKPAVRMVFPPKTGAADAGTRIVFFPLNGWSVDSRTLRLELPEEHFTEAGKLQVWFLREGDAMWAETARWPGYPKPAATSSVRKPRASEASPPKAEAKPKP